MSAPQGLLLDYPFDAPPAPGQAREVAPRMFWLRMPLPFALDHINLWLLKEADSITQIDCGYGDAATRELWTEHFKTTLDGRPITRIVATHCHPDHLGNAKWLSDRFGAAVAMTEAEFLAAHAIIDQRAVHSINAGQCRRDLFVAIISSAQLTGREENELLDAVAIILSGNSNFQFKRRVHSIRKA